MKLPFDIDLKDKVVVITGGTGVIGSAMSTALAQSGAKVAMVGLREDASGLVEAIKELGGESRVFLGDVTNKEDMKRIKQEVNDTFGSVDILINGAGGNAPKGTTDDEHFEGNLDQDKQTFFNLDEESVGFVMDLNFLGTFIPSQVFATDMLDKEDATIINISSMNAFTPLTKIPAYSGAKAAISNFTQWLSVYFSKTNIRVNAIAPGFLLTKQNEALLLNEDGSYTDRSKKIINATPMERFGKPEELVGALLFLVSKEASSFVNGVVLPVDGGFNAYSGV
ncbi:SDR family oxidoreductase [Staphylococcus haemolyticus]|uniref:SDR family oxidoreductase n=1 Tax=Staphylococcus TaxID=1279 RepID=UPI00069D5E33|nr:MULTISPECIES: SDR family oxidoreductase [Staphylococcus]KAA2275019.1 SDR family oxidoreductase [Staphylococcus sp. GDX7P312P]KAA2279971.1 SDR family oxidoreductase [Staphylococcus sp. GDX7P459A]MCE4954691.1 SDR family oxidoreductase [Staphylococcus haemolyticus]MCE4963928.1 SDR family oxidoreductase [Staphylococcus haemolyticus]MCE4987967.1 SDR family oxidoreductase [Staphylococcus haemolyticus]